jgi:glycine/D-amino acid oxidase-like deaminating enzyme
MASTPPVNYRSLSLWHDTLPADDVLEPRPGLPGDQTVDVAIVGGGFTGLWTAHYLREADPTLRIAIIEKDIAGFGASGRNGGWASAILPMSLDAIAHAHGRDAAIRMQRAMYDGVDEIGRAADALGIDCQYAKGGTLRLVRNPAQAPRVHAALAHKASYGLTDEVWLDRAQALQRTNATELIGASYTPNCAAVHPARLARGLAASVASRGVAIYEQTTADTIEPHRIHTDRGTVTADIVMRATEGFTPMLKAYRRAIVPIYSLMIATEPLPDEVWNDIGLRERETFNDARHSIIYGQRTRDGRFAFGGRGAPYHYGSAIHPDFDRDAAVHRNILSTLVDLYPQIKDAKITHRWGGPLGAARDWHCSVVLDRATGMARAGGYVGDGVTTTNIAGRTMADLILRRDTELTTLPWVGHQSRQWEPEPLRWIAIRSALRLALAADRSEVRRRKPERARSWVLDKLTGH